MSSLTCFMGYIIGEAFHPDQFYGYIVSEVGKDYVIATNKDGDTLYYEKGEPVINAKLLTSTPHESHTK